MRVGRVFFKAKANEAVNYEAVDHEACVTGPVWAQKRYGVVGGAGRDEQQFRDSSHRNALCWRGGEKHRACAVGEL